MQNCRFSSFLPRLYSTVFLYSTGVFTAELHFRTVILTFEQLFFHIFSILQTVEFTSPTAALIVLSAVDDMEYHTYTDLEPYELGGGESQELLAR